MNNNNLIINKVIKKSIIANTIVLINSNESSEENILSFINKINKIAKNDSITNPIFCLQVDDLILTQIKDKLYNESKPFFDDYPFQHCTPKFDKLISNGKNQKSYYRFVHSQNIKSLLNEDRSFNVIHIYEKNIVKIQENQTNIKVNSFQHLLQIL
jgi:hypothetical protein